MPPLSCDQGEVSWMSQNWPSAEASRVTAPMRSASIATNAAAMQARATRPVVRIAYGASRYAVRAMIPIRPGTAHCGYFAWNSAWTVCAVSSADLPWRFNSIARD